MVEFSNSFFKWLLVPAHIISIIIFISAFPFILKGLEYLMDKLMDNDFDEFDN